MADSRTNLVATNRATTPTGTFRKNTLCQPRLSTSTPPSTGPAASASADTPAQMPMACARSSGSGNVLVRIDRVPGSSSAAPTPCTPRPTMSAWIDGARPQESEPRVNTARPLMKARLRPYMSPSVPPLSMRLANSSV